MRKILLIIYIINIYINIISPEKLLKIPFKLFLTSCFYKDNPEIISNKFMSQPVIELSIGTPPQKFNISLDIKDNFYSCFLKNNLPNINFSSLYNKSSSLTYKCEQNKTLFPIEIFNEAEIFSDNINFGTENKNIEKNMRFLLIDNLRKTVLFPGLIGLALKNDNRQLNENAFIYQLKKYGLIDTEIFYFNFENEQGGQFIIGENLFNNENYKKIRVGSIHQLSSKLLWSFNFDGVYYGNTQNLGNENAVFELGYGLTIGSSNYENIIKVFFQNEINCYLNSTNIGSIYLKYYWCEKDNIIEEKMQNLTFELKSINFNFTFNGKDLFFEKDNKKFFKILFLFDNFQVYWYLGHDFLEKYKIRFDLERKLLYIPLKETEDDTTPSEISNNSDNDISYLLKSWQFWIAVSLGIVIIGLIIFIIIYIKKYPKKKKVYELDNTDEDYNDSKKENLNENNIN